MIIGSTCPIFSARRTTRIPYRSHAPVREGRSCGSSARQDRSPRQRQARDFDTLFYRAAMAQCGISPRTSIPSSLIDSFIAAGKPIGIVCHSTGALHRVKMADGKFLVQGKEVTGFTDGEEEAMGLTKVVPFLVEDEMLKLGAVFSKVANWGIHVVRDGLLITGQNRASSDPAAKTLMAAAEAKGAPVATARCVVDRISIERLPIFTDAVAAVIEEAATAVHRGSAPRFLIGGTNMSLDTTLTATADSTLPDPTRSGFAEKLYRLDGGHSLANDESVWTPGENVGRSIAFSSTCWLMQRGSKWLLWDTGVPGSALNDPKGWSTLPKLIVYHLDRTLTDQLAMIGLRDNRHHLCCAVRYSRRPHWQRSLVPGFNGSDAGSRVQVDQFSRRLERQRQSAEGSRT